MKHENLMKSSDRVYSYLNIDDPICAWATYRGVLKSPPAERGFLSVWHAGILKNWSVDKLNIETKMEEIRIKAFPQMTSRLRGMFCFRDSHSARLASQNWGNHFSLHNLSELEVLTASKGSRIHDANWFTWANNNPSESLVTHKWIEDYWSGRPYPKEEAIWEMIVDGEFIVCNKALREKAYTRIRGAFPNSIAFLEVARIGAYLQSDLGSIHGYLLAENVSKIELTYLMDMRDADNPDFLNQLRHFMKSGEPVNRNDLAPYFSRDSLGNVPDLRPYGHSWVSTG